MIQPREFVELLHSVGINFFTGVPDSLLKEFCAYVDDASPIGSHIIAANEGNSVALAAGYHMATGKIAAVYLQNSGLGNAINPLTSLTDAEVYQIPMLLIIGWRGEPGVKDEPQHVKQGRITLSQLDVLEIPYQILDADSVLDDVVSNVAKQLSIRNSPVAILVRKDAFGNYKSRRKSTFQATMDREDALRGLLSLIGDASVVSTTGKTSREVFELRVERGETQRDFLTVGGMGHTASIALGVALGQPSKLVVCIDGDGSVLMHLGALPIIGSLKPSNLIHVLLNNAAHESVGGQPTVGGVTDFRAIALASGYSKYYQVSTLADLKGTWAHVSKGSGPVMLEIRITTKSRADLGRPTSTPVENKKVFMEWLAR